MSGAGVTTGATASEAGTSAAPSGSAGSSRAARALRMAVLMTPAVMVGIGGWVHRWTDEDAFINFRVVDQIFAGHGPVFNAGERVEVYTSTAWLGVLVVGRALFGWLMGPEWISVLAGVTAAVAGFALAALAGRRLVRSRSVALPLGLVAVAAVPVVWDFATSGLEMGFAWLWIGACAFRLAGVATTEATVTRWSRRWSLVILGFGPLVRPDLALMTIAFLGAWLVLVRPRRVVADMAIAFAVPIAYQVFRMGYFASLVPNTALAKDSGGLYVTQGWRYFTDLVGTYALWVPFTVLVVAMVVRAITRPDSRQTVVVVAMVGAGLAHAGYMVVSGGDYMHGRLLLPALFAVATPATFALPVGSRRRSGSESASRSGMAATARFGLAVTVVVVWSVVVIVGVRYPAAPPVTFGVADISDWRSVLHGEMFHRPTGSLTVTVYELRERHRAGMRGYFRVVDKKPRPGKDPNRLVLTFGSIGVPAWMMGPDVFIVDIGGLGEPLAARAAPIPGRAAGHRKSVSYRWYDARFGAARGDERVRAARRALRCGELAELIDAVDGELTFGRFLSNLWRAPGLTLLDVPRDPRVAEARFCN